MKLNNPFDKYSREYEEWFLKNSEIFRSELKALARVMPFKGRGLEIGVGSGLFAENLKISHGTDPSLSMLELARKRGVNVRQGIAENLPWPDRFFDYAVFITSLCFIEKQTAALNEAKRVIKPEGCLIIAFIDRDSEAGQIIMSKKKKSRFYKDAELLSITELEILLKTCGFEIKKIIHTLKSLNTVAEEEPFCGQEAGNFTIIKSEVQQKFSQR